MKDEKAWKWLNENELSYSIWENKYRYNNETFDQWLDRISKRNKVIKDLILQKKFAFGGRIMANRGLNDVNVSLSNCYVVTPPDDDLASIMRVCKDLAITYSRGGGCGVDISKLRPCGAAVNNAAKESTGPTSFMELYSQVTGTISQQGRRGALMISMDVNHPDIESFIDIKTDTAKVNYANISVRINNDFMKAVELDKDYILYWPLSEQSLSKIGYNLINNNPSTPYNKLIPVVAGVDKNGLDTGYRGYIKRVRAKDLYTKLCKSNWDYAEPGILYWSRIKQFNILNNNSVFEFAGVNPCAEEPLGANGACLLGSINLSKYVNNPYKTNSEFNFDSLAKDTHYYVMALNEVLAEGYDKHPLKEQTSFAKNWRAIGLGTMGLAEAFIELGIKYDSQQAIDLTVKIMKTIAIEAIKESNELAKVAGCFPGANNKVDKLNIILSEFIKSLDLPDDIVKSIEKYGLFNSQILTCAPTGSISNLYQTSGGIEPYFSFAYERTTKSLVGEDKIFEVREKVVDDFLKGTGLTEWKNHPAFVCSQDIDPMYRVQIQASAQKYIDASISSTINLPNSATVEDVENLYHAAYKAGCKGLTIFRAGCKRVAILNEKKPEKEVETTSNNIATFNSIEPVHRSTLGTTYGQTQQKKCACGKLYVTCNKDKDGHIVEIFTHTSKGGICQANLNAVTRMASLSLRSGVKVGEIIDQLKGIHCPACQALKAKGQKVDGLSCPDIMSKVLSDTFSLNIQEDKEEVQPEIIQEEDNGLIECPECHKKTLRHESGCVQCVNCGYSKCN